MINKSKFAFHISHQVRWGEMDALGHVNNVTYFSYYENVRIEYFKSLGFNSINIDESLGPVLASISCNFLKPVVYPDTIIIGAGIRKVGNTSIQLDYDIFSEQQQDIVSTGSSVVVMINYQTGIKVRVSDEIREMIRKIEG